MKRDFSEHSIAENIIDLYQHRPKTAIFMSGQGSNALELLSDEAVRDLYDIQLLFTDNVSSRAPEIAEKTQVPDMVYGTDTTFKSSDERENYFAVVSNHLHLLGVEAIFYAGFMKIVPEKFCKDFLGVNIHPADLTLLGSDGLPLYRGMHAMGKMRNHLEVVRSTVHAIDLPLDSGQSISLSDILHPPEELTDEEVHNMLKNEEHRTYKKTLRLLGSGTVSVDMLPMSMSQMEELENGK